MGIASVLFKNRQGKPRNHVGLEETNRVYSSFLEPLLEAHNFLSEQFLYLINNCMTSSRLE